MRKPEWMIAVLALVPMLAWDITARRVPNSLVVILLAASIGGMLAGLWGWSIAGLLAGTIYTAIAGFPGGDVKAMGILGGLLGLPAISGVFAVACVITLAGWKLRRPTAPWLVHVAVAAGIAWSVGRLF